MNANIKSAVTWQTQSLANYIHTIVHPFFAITWLSLIFLSYVFIDKPLAIYMHQFQTAEFVQLAKCITVFGLGIIYIFISLLLFLITRYLWINPKWAHIALYFFLLVAVTGLSCDVIKIILSRARPVEFFQSQLYGFYFFNFDWRMWSFPSGHATTIATVTLAASLLWPRFWIGFLLLTILVAASRIIVTMHYLSDVMLGWYLGSLLTLVITLFLSYKGWLELPIDNAVLFPANIAIKAKNQRCKHPI